MIKPIFGAEGPVVPPMPTTFKGAPPIRYSMPVFTGAPQIRHHEMSFKPAPKPVPFPTTEKSTGKLNVIA